MNTKYGHLEKGSGKPSFTRKSFSILFIISQPLQRWGPMKKMYVMFTALIIASIMLSACGSPLPTSTELLIALCADERQGPIKLFGEQPMQNAQIIRMVAGGAAKPPAGMIAGLDATEHVDINEVFLVAHLQGDCPGCGGLKAKAS